VLPDGLAGGCVQVLGGLAGGGGLGGVPLSLPQRGDGVGERGEAHDQAHLGQAGVVGGERGGGQQPGGPPEAVPGRGGAGDPAVRDARGAAVRAGGLPDDPAAEH